MRHPSRPRPHLITVDQIAPLTPTLTLSCKRCDRRGRLSMARLLAEWGQYGALADVAAGASADCERRQAHSIYDRCGAHWL